jgi:RNA polymerase sigma factor (sigma-70 family)
MSSESSATEQTDESLMLRYSRGEMKAFEVLYDRHHMGCWRFIFRSVHIQETADDILQDVWFAVARQAHSYKPIAKFRTWLFTIAHHAVVDHFRTTKDMISLDAQTEIDDASTCERSAPELIANSGFGPLRQLESREQALALLKAIEQLPIEQREAFLLQAEAEMSVTEIADATGVSFETAKSRLRYARAHLRELLLEVA